MVLARHPLTPMTPRNAEPKTIFFSGPMLEVNLQFGLRRAKPFFMIRLACPS